MCVSVQEDYYEDCDGSNIPVRWLPPEALQVYDDGGIILKRLTKESNVWYAELFNGSINIARVPFD